MSKYEALDQAILEMIVGPPQLFAAIFVREVRRQCEAHAAAEGDRHV
ncbi:hypothetical protein [Massilia sp. PWRC2]